MMYDFFYGLRLAAKLRAIFLNLLLVTCYLFLGTCDLFNNPTDPDYLDNIRDEIAYANAPWVPLYIETGGFGTATLMLSQPNAVKLGYSFTLGFVPSGSYGFKGWQAWTSEGIIASFVLGDNFIDDPDDFAESNPKRVKFVPKNSSGTEAEIFVYEMPPAGESLYIGPWGASTTPMTVTLDSGGLGTIFPASVTVKQGFPFTINFNPSSDYTFQGWMILFDGFPVSQWSSGPVGNTVNGINWSPLNATGTDCSVTIEELPSTFNPFSGSITIMPLGGNNDEIIIQVTAPPSWGNGYPAGTLSRKLGFPIDIGFNPSGSYAFRGWQARFASGEIFEWKNEGGNDLNDFIIWSQKNASGTEMIIVVKSTVEALSVTLQPLGSDNGVANVSITSFDTAWGTASPLVGEKWRGFSFDVEFTPSSAYAFTGWKAYSSSSPAQWIAVNEYPQEDVEISAVDGNNLKARVTVNTGGEVYLVPVCYLRPRLDSRTNPPLSPIQTAFPFDQTVNLWFTMPTRQETAVLGETIRIRAVHTADRVLTIDGKPVTKKRGEPFGINNDGGITGYFNITFPANNRIDLIPKDSGEYPSAHLALLNISVSVGPGIESADNIAMGETQTVSYITDFSEAQKVYKPGVISASRTETGGYFRDTGTQWNNPAIDRRFNGTDKSTAFLQFSVTAPPVEGVSPVPNRITIVELQAYTLRGFPGSGTVLETVYELPHPDVSLAGGTYTVAHKLKAAQGIPAPGIFQLIVLPWYEDADAAIEPQMMAAAMSEGHYVTIVLDTAAPDIQNMNASLSAHASIDTDTVEGSSIYVFGENTPFTLTIGGLANLTDNGTQGGIPVSQAWSLPWTMDDTGALKWYARIGEESGTGTITEGPFNVYNDTALNNTWPADISDLAAPTGYRVYVRFEDSLGNQSQWQDTSLRVKYSTETINSVKNLKAVVNDGGNLATISWEQTGPYQSAIFTIRRYRTSGTGDVLDGEETRTADYGTNTFSLSVPAIPAGAISGVRNGNAVTGFYGYEISAVTKNIAGDSADVGPIWIYNIPGMVTQGSGTETDSNTIRISGTMSSLPAAPHQIVTAQAGEQLAVSSGKNFVLTNDVVLSNWAPIANFQDKFYGNGHTVTITGMTAGPDMGMFGAVSGSAIIRDLTVAYGDTAIGGASTVTNVGGIAGRADGTTQILNCITRSASPASTLTVTANAETRLGGIAGCLDGTSYIRNCLASLNVTGTATGSQALHIGGVIGYGNSTGTLTDVTAANTVSMDKTGGAEGVNILGGIAGSITRTNLSDCEFSGTINIPNTFNTAGNTFIGGIAGMIETNTAAVTIENTVASADITVHSAGAGKLNVGGIAGASQGIAGAVTFRNTRYIDKAIRVFKTGSPGLMEIGGFIGDAVNNNKFTSCWSTGLVNVNYQAASGADNLSNLNIGGFAGALKGNAELCYSKTSIEVSINSADSRVKHDELRHCIGGFGGLIGETDSYTIKQCYASGSVTVTSEKDESFNYCIGGFVGRYNLKVTIQDCYAAGNIMLDRLKGGDKDKDEGDSSAGGFAGGFARGMDNNNSLIRCIASGSVTVKSNRNDGGSIGGLVAWVENNNNTTIENCVAFNPSVTGQTGEGGFKIRLARIYVTHNSGDILPDKSGNHAVDTLILYSKKGEEPIQQVPLNTVDVVHDGMHGATVIRVTISTTFWRGLEYDSVIWDMGAPVTRNGWPTLRGVGGQ